jgi:hypothetical protein
MSNTFARSLSMPPSSDDERNSGDREEGIVRDILDELDRERKRRAELEAQLRETTEQQALDLLTGKSSVKHPTKKDLDNQAPLSPSSRSPASRQEWIALQTERDGYKELLNALTADNDAITTAARAPSTKTSLPLHIVRLLEIMPWHAQALEHASANEEIFEWQHFVRGQWTSMLRLFPIRFRTLPIVKTQQKDLPKRIFGGEQPPKQGVLTDTALTKIIDVSHGYPLPNDEFATWQWVSGWRINKTPDIQKQKIGCDQHGWSYAKDPEHFLTNAADLCWPSPFEEGKDEGTVTRPFRLRSWKRRRVLISYQQASQCALEYLQLLSENARLGATVQNLNDQLAETKTKLKDAEEKLIQSQENSELELKELRDQLKEKDTSPKELEKSNEATSSDRLTKGRSGLASSWGSLPSTASSDGDDIDDKEGDKDTEDGEDRRFGWGRFGGGGLIDHIKRSPAGNALLQGRNGTDHARSASADPILSLPTLEEK